MRLDINEVQTEEHQCFYTSAVVYLNGVQVNWVVEADDEEGYIVRYKTKSSKFSVANDEIIKERLFGKVEIRFKE